MCGCSMCESVRASLEALAERGILRKRGGQHFDGNGAVEPRIAPAVPGVVYSVTAASRAWRNPDGSRAG